MRVNILLGIPADALLKQQYGGLAASHLLGSGSDLLMERERQIAQDRDRQLRYRTHISSCANVKDRRYTGTVSSDLNFFFIGWIIGYDSIKFLDFLVLFFLILNRALSF
jgi:hypothetical protein